MTACWSNAEGLGRVCGYQDAEQCSQCKRSQNNTENWNGSWHADPRLRAEHISCETLVGWWHQYPGVGPSPDGRPQGVAGRWTSAGDSWRKAKAPSWPVTPQHTSGDLERWMVVKGYKTDQKIWKSGVDKEGSHPCVISSPSECVSQLTPCEFYRLCLLVEALEIEN